MKVVDVYRTSILYDNGFESFLRGVNVHVCLRHDRCSK